MKPSPCPPHDWFPYGGDKPGEYCYDCLVDRAAWEASQKPKPKPARKKKPTGSINATPKPTPKRKKR